MAHLKKINNKNIVYDAFAILGLQMSFIFQKIVLKKVCNI